MMSATFCKIFSIKKVNGILKDKNEDFVGTYIIKRYN